MVDFWDCALLVGKNLFVTHHLHSLSIFQYPLHFPFADVLACKKKIGSNVGAGLTVW